MSVPLDRLYNFLHDVCNHRDLIIYRFSPHGSKKISDLSPLQNLPVNFKHWNSRYIIFHDQEPLDYDAYNNTTLVEDYIKNNQDKIIKIDLPDSDQRLNSFYSKLNLRMALYPVTYAYKPVLLVHSEKNSQNLWRYEQELGMAGVYWWSHAAIARDWFRFAEHDLSLDLRNVSHDFLVYNRAWSGTREYRLKFAELLIDYDIVQYCQTKFACQDNAQHYTNHVFNNKTFQIYRTDLEQIFEPNIVDSTASADYASHDYSSTQLEIVLETLFDDNRIQVTEKSLRPIACGHPFMLLATAGSLEYLRSYGFETFGSHIDESYDTIQNPVSRMRSIVTEMQRLASLSLDQKQQLYGELRLIAARNKQLFFSKSWHDLVIQEYKNNFIAALTIDKKFKVDVSDLCDIIQS